MLVPALDAELAGAAAEALGLHLHPGRTVPRRPRAVVDGDEVDLVLFALGDEWDQHRIEVLARPGGVLVAAGEETAPLVREALDRAAPEAGRGESTGAMVVLTCRSLRRDAVRTAGGRPPGPRCGAGVGVSGTGPDTGGVRSGVSGPDRTGPVCGRGQAGRDRAVRSGGPNRSAGGGCGRGSRAPRAPRRPR